MKQITKTKPHENEIWLRDHNIIQLGNGVIHSFRNQHVARQLILIIIQRNNEGQQHSNMYRVAYKNVPNFGAKL